MKLRTILLAALTISLATAAEPTAEKWEPMPEDLAAEVNGFFTSLELALNNRRIEPVMSLYTPDAVEEIQIGKGAMFNVDQIRARRVEDMQRYAESGKGAPVLDRSHLRFQPGEDANHFVVQYLVFRPDPKSGTEVPVGELDYTFVRGERGLQLKRLLARSAAAAQASKPAPKFPVGRDGLPTEVELVNGVKLHQVSVVQWLPDKLILKHVAGTDPIAFDRIVPEQRALFLAQLDKRLEIQRRVYTHAARVNDAREREEAAQKAADQAVEDFNARIDAAIAEHRLMVGMTMDQVKRSWGAATQSNTVDGTEGRGIMWIYENRGMDAHGNLTNAGIGFVNGVVTELYNVRKQ